jgi:hypothetical protein
LLGYIDGALGGARTGCCYNFWFGLPTSGDQATFSNFLSWRLAGQTMPIWKTDPTAARPIEIAESSKSHKFEKIRALGL